MWRRAGGSRGDRRDGASEESTGVALGLASASEWACPGVLRRARRRGEKRVSRRPVGRGSAGRCGGGCGVVLGCRAAAELACSARRFPRLEFFARSVLRDVSEEL